MITLEQLNAIPRPSYFELGEWHMLHAESYALAYCGILTHGGIVIRKNGNISIQTFGLVIPREELHNLLDYLDQISNMLEAK